MLKDGGAESQLVKYLVWNYQDMKNYAKLVGWMKIQCSP